MFSDNSYNSEFKNKMENNNLRYWFFSGGDGSGPVYLKLENIVSIPSDAIFARKVKYASQVRQILEKRLQKKRLIRHCFLNNKKTMIN